jgi:hypothetical protein
MVDIEIVGIHCSIFSRGPYTYKTHLWTPFKPVKTIPDLKWTETSWFRSNDFGLASTRCGWMPSRFTCVSRRRPKGATCDMQKIAPVWGELGSWTLNVLRWCTTHVYTRSILDGSFKPLVFWYQWEYLLTSKDFFLQGIWLIGNVYMLYICTK